MISFHKLTLCCDRNPAVHHLDGTIERSGFTALVSPNGGVPRRRIAYLPQQAGLDRRFPLAVWDLVALGTGIGSDPVVQLAVPMPSRSSPRSRPSDLTTSAPDPLNRCRV